MAIYCNIHAHEVVKQQKQQLKWRKEKILLLVIVTRDGQLTN